MENHRILLVEEDVKNLHATSRALSHMGYDVTTCAGNEAVVAELDRLNFDLVITNSLSVLEESKQARPEAMVILVLPCALKIIPSGRALRFDADDYLFKPFEWSELGMRVARCLGNWERVRKRSASQSQGDPLYEKVLTLLKILSQDIQKSLISMSATLKLLNRGYYGAMDENVANGLKELLSKTIDLIKMTEGDPETPLSFNEDIETWISKSSLFS